MYGRKHFCHPASNRKLQQDCYIPVIPSDNGTTIHLVNSSKGYCLGNLTD